MDAFLGNLIRTLSERGTYEELRGHHKVLRQAAKCMQNDQHYPLIEPLLAYAERYGNYPNLASLGEYITKNPYHVTKDEDRARCLAALLVLTDPATPFQILQGDWKPIIDEYVVFARSMYYTMGLRSAMLKISNASDLPTENSAKVAAERQTPSDRIALSLKYIDHLRGNDFTAPPMEPEGAWKDNAELSADALIEGLKDTIKERCYTGYKHIDGIVSMGPKQSVKYVGILGFTNHGKSMYMRSMAYNMARAGKRILYIAREDSALNTITQLSFLHAYERPDLHIPTINIWRNNPKQVTPEEQDNLRLLVDDLQHGNSVPGEVVVKTCPRWSEILQELETGLNGNPYDVLMIDYLSHLETDSKRPGDMHQDILALFKKAQALCQDYRGGRGLVVITPLQANKAAMNAANAAEGDEWGEYADLGAVEQYTGACRDMDLVIGLWHRGPLKLQGILKVFCMKSREAFFPPHFMMVDSRTRKVMDLPGGPKCNVAEIALYKQSFYDDGLTDEEIVRQSGI